MSHQYSILLLAFIGTYLSAFILRKKYKKEKLICYLGEDCNKVIYSKYSRLLFNIPNEILGILYYGLVFITTLFFIVYPELLTISISMIRYIIGGFAALFSIALIFIQLGIIKEWCEYCLFSALISLFIFLFLII